MAGSGIHFSIPVSLFSLSCPAHQPHQEGIVLRVFFSVHIHDCEARRLSGMHLLGRRCKGGAQ